MLRCMNDEYPVIKGGSVSPPRSPIYLSSCSTTTSHRQHNMYQHLHSYLPLSLSNNNILIYTSNRFHKSWHTHAVFPLASNTELILLVEMKSWKFKSLLSIVVMIVQTQDCRRHFLQLSHCGIYMSMSAK